MCPAYLLITFANSLDPDQAWQKSGLIWIRTVWHAFWWYPSKTFWKEFVFGKTTAGENKPVQLFSMQRVQPFTYQPRSCRLLLLSPCCFRYPIMHECARSPGPLMLAYVTCTKLLWMVPKLLAWAFTYIPWHPFFFRDSLIAYALSTKLIKIWQSLHLQPFFIMRFTKALAILRKCSVSPDSPLLTYVTSTKVSWTGL